MWYDTTHGARYALRSPEADANGWEIYNYFHNLTPSWSTESIAAMCGNWQHESVMNPFIRYTTESGGFGLAQWITNKSNLISWATSQGLTPTSGPAQVQYVEQERQGIDDQWLRRGDYAQSFDSFAYNQQSMSVAQLTRCFNDCFERPNQWWSVRVTNAEYYYQLFGGTPPGPSPTADPWLYFKKRPWWKPGGRKYINA